MNQHDSAKYYLKKGNEYFQLGKFQDAIKYFDNVIAYFNHAIDKDSNNLKNAYAKACLKKAECLNYLGKYQDAIKCADDTIKIKIIRHEDLALIIKAESLNYLGRIFEALYFVNTALNLSRLDYEAKCHALFVKGYSLQYIGHYPAALNQIKLAIDGCDDEDNAVDALITNGIILNQEERYDEAIESFDKAIKKSFKKKYRIQDIAYAFINKSVSHLGLKRKYDALFCCNEAIKYSSESILNNPKDIHAWMIQGVALFQLEFYDMAIECYDKVIMDIDCKFDFVWHLKGHALNYLERYDEGLKYFDKAITINKERAITIKREVDITIPKKVLAITINKEGDITIHEEEDVIINKEGDITINKEEIIDSDIDYYIGEGISLYYLGRYKDAINCFTKDALNKDSAYNDIVLFSRGASYYAEKCYHKALDDFRNIKDVNFKGKKRLEIIAQKCTNIGACYHKLGLYKDARDKYKEAIKNNSTLVEASYNLGVLYYNEGNVDTAKKLFESCVNTDNKFTKAKEALEKLNSNLTDSSEWFKWWFTRGIGKKVFGITLILSILISIGIVIAMTTIILISYYQNMESDNQTRTSAGNSPNTLDNKTDNQTRTSEMLNIDKEVISLALTASVILIALLIVILLFPSIRRVKVGNIIDLEPVTTDTNIPKQMEPLSIKIRFGMQSF